MSVARTVMWALTGMALLGAGPVSAQTYRTTNIGTLGGTQAFPAHITGSYIAGGSLTTEALEGALIWNSPPGLSRLPGFGGSISVALDVNSRGNSVGLAFLTDDMTEHAVAWLYGTPVDLKTLTDGGISEAYGINSDDMIVGVSTVDDLYSYRGCIWQEVIVNGISTIETTDVGLLPGGAYSQLNAVNNLGQAVGLADTVLGSGVQATAGEHAVLWDATGGLRDLGTLGGTNSAAWAINSTGEVVGSSDTASGQQHAFLWDSVHGMHDLGLLTGYDSTVAYSINNVTQVTGEAYNSTTHQTSSFVWDRQHGMRDANSLIGPRSGFTLSGVVNNDQGWLAAVGHDPLGAETILLLKP